MTISTTTNKTIQSGNGTNKNFDFSFTIPDEDSLVLVKRDADNIETLITTNYSVSGIGSASGGTVVYPVSGDALSSDEKILIKRVVSLTQPTDFRNQGSYSLEDIEDSLDRNIMVSQQLQEEFSRCLKLPISSQSTFTEVDDFIAGRILIVSEDGTKLTMSSLPIAAIEADLGILAAISEEINTLADISTDISTVASISSDVSTVASISSDVSMVADIAANVSRVADIAGSVSVVAGIQDNIALVVSNLVSIINASSFGFPVTTIADAAKHLKVNAAGTGYDLIAGATLNALAAKVIGIADTNIPIIGTSSATEVLAGLARFATLVETKAGANAAIAISAKNLADYLASRRYESAAQVIPAAAGSLTVTHGLLDNGVAAKPKKYKIYIVCTTADQGYSVGDETEIKDFDTNDNGPGYGYSMVPTTTQLIARFGNAGKYMVLHKTSGAASAITRTSWVAILRASLDF